MVALWCAIRRQIEANVLTPKQVRRRRTCKCAYMDSERLTATLYSAHLRHLALLHSPVFTAVHRWSEPSEEGHNEDSCRLRRGPSRGDTAVQGKNEKEAPASEDGRARGTRVSRDRTPEDPLLKDSGRGRRLHVYGMALT